MTPEAEFVGRLRKQHPDVDDEIDIFMAWLQEKGPDEWHRWAINWNWDHGTGLLEWIIEQPNCDRGTALSIYYGAQPDYYTQYASVEEALAECFEKEVVIIMMRICELWAKGYYSTYVYRPSDVGYLVESEEARLAIAAASPWSVPDSLSRTGIQGEENDFERSIDGISIEMLRALGEDW